MNQTDFEALMERMDDVFNEVQHCRRAVEYLENHTQDDNLMSTLGLIRQQLGKTEYRIHELMGCPLHQATGTAFTGEDVPFD